MNGAPWETISELFSFVAIQKPTRTQPKVLEFVKCQSINGALACAPQATARQVELRQKCQSINGALACAPYIMQFEWTISIGCQSINGALACAPQATARQVELRQKCQSINGALACAPCRTSTSLPTLVEVSVDQWRAGLRAPAKTLCLL